MFVTINTKNRMPIFVDSACARIAVEKLYAVQEYYPYYLHSFVVMPDHCHILLTPPEDTTISRIMYTYKRKVSFDLVRGPIWQPRFDCRLVRHSADVVRYIHNNPVRKGLCNRPEDYPWSSASGRWDIIVLDWMGCFT